MHSHNPTLPFPSEPPDPKFTHNISTQLEICSYHFVEIYVSYKSMRKFLEKISQMSSNLENTNCAVLLLQSHF